MQLEQGNLSVTDYATIFKHLTRFNTQIMTKDWRSKKFEFGLRQELKEVVVPLSIREFPALMEKAKVVENLKNSGKVVKPLMVGGPSNSRLRYEDKKKSYSRLQCFSSGGSNPKLPPSVKCFRCGGQRMITFCPYSTLNVTCDKYHKYGHATKDCHVRFGVPSSSGVQQVQQNNNQKPKAAGRVFNINGVEASQSDSLVKGICFILGTQLSVLFDSRATHSIISVDCVKKLKLPVCELDVELVVSTPTKGIIITSFVCNECPVIINGQKYKINMISIHMNDLKVILGMDWLSANHTLIDCGEKKLIFPKSENT